MQNLTSSWVLALALLSFWAPLEQAHAATTPASAEIAPFPDSLAYEKPSSEGQVACRSHVDDLKQLFDFFHASNFTYLNEKFGDGEDFLGSDQIFARFEESRYVYFIMNLNPTDKQFRNRLVKLGENFIFHGTTAHGMPYGLMFENFSPREVTAIAASLEGWRASLPQSPEVSAGSAWLIHSANAGDPVCPVEKPTKPGEGRSAKEIVPVKLDAKQVKPVENAPDIEELLNEGFFKRAWRCAGNALHGALDTLAAPFVFVGHVVRTGYRLVTNPKEVWANTKGTFGKINESLQSLTDEGLIGFTTSRAHNRMQAFRDLPPGGKTAAVCDFVGRALAVAAEFYIYPRLPFGKVENLLGGGKHLPGALKFNSTKDAALWGKHAAGKLHGMSLPDLSRLRSLLPNAPWPPGFPPKLPKVPAY